MATMKVLMRKRNIKGDKFPIIIRVIHKRKQAQYTIPDLTVKEEYWDEKDAQIKVSSRKDPMYNRAPVLNSQINNYKRKLEEAIDELHLAKTPFDVQDILDLAFGKKEKASEQSFYQYFKEYYEVNPDELKPGTLLYYNTTMQNWKACHGNLLIKDITGDHILKFRKHLKSSGLATNTVYNRMKTIRKMIRRAMRQELLVKDPFLHITLKQEKGTREHLTVEELKSFAEVAVKSKTENLTKDIFLFGCYTGLRFGDICRLRNKNFNRKNGKYYLTIRMAKTRSNLSFPLNDKAQVILEKYKKDNGEAFLFPFLDKLGNTTQKSVSRKVSSANAMVNRYLKDLVERAGIDKHCSFHVSRHTYACVSLELGADIYVLSKMLGHSSVATTEIYAKVVDKRKVELVDMWNKQ